MYLCNKKDFTKRDEQVQKKKKKKGLKGLGPNNEVQQNTSNQNKCQKPLTKVKQQNLSSLELKDACDRAFYTIFNKVVCHPIH